MRRKTLLSLGLAAALAAGAGLAACGRLAPRPHNVVIFVADGLRYSAVNAEVAPALQAVRAEGVDFRNSHSLYPTVTTPNASAIATGHRLADTGDFANSVYLGEPAAAAAFGALVAAYEDDTLLGDANGRFGGNYLNEETLLAAARGQGYSTAAIGKLGPTAIQDVTARDGRSTIVVDDSTGYPEGLPLSAEIKAAMKHAGLAATAPDRGLNADPGTSIMAGVHVANTEQQDWFAAVATEVVLPRFKAANRPFVMVFWSRDPDGTQHNQGDSLDSLTPGINGPTSRAAIRNASNDLQKLRDKLKALGLDRTTDIVVTADHGFSTASKQSATSSAAKKTYADVPAGFLPPGFLAIDLAGALGLPLYEPNGVEVLLKEGAHPKHGSAILGKDTLHPEVVIGANGGSDLIWLPGRDRGALARRIAAFLVTQDYVGGLFADDALGAVPGALPLGAIGLKGAARTPLPGLIVEFRSFSTGCSPDPQLCGAEVADTDLQQGQGIHGSFGRADTRNFMAAVGPDFKAGFADPAPVSNADLAWTAARILKLELRPKGREVGRAIEEAFPNRPIPKAAGDTVRSAPAANGFVTVLKRQRLGATPYFDAAGMPGRVLGLEP
jgi:arylsulfatase A-like enzyme